MQINEPVTGADEHTACHIAEGDGKQIFCGKAEPVKSLCSELIFGGCKDACGNVEHVCHAVLIAGQNEYDDRKIKADHLSHCGGCANGDPDCDADEDVAQNAAQKGIGKGKGGLRSGGIYKRLSELAVKETCRMAVNEDCRNEKGTGQIAEIYDDPASEKFGNFNFFLKNRND